jgi:hypothetical protein
LIQGIRMLISNAQQVAWNVQEEKSSRSSSSANTTPIASHSSSQQNFNYTESDVGSSYGGEGKGTSSVITPPQPPADNQSALDRDNNGKSGGIQRDEGIAGNIDQATAVRRNRRLSLRESVIEDAKKQQSISSSGASGSNGNIAASVPSRSALSLSTAPSSSTSSSIATSSSSHLPQSTTSIMSAPERQIVEKLKIQNMQLSNDVQDRDDAILALKRREAELSTVLEQRDKMYKQDEIVRNQLSYKLQKVLMDKEEANERCEKLEEQMAVLRGKLKA